jgi:acetyltransferase-like isoleucine patch superfamily enzyme
MLRFIKDIYKKHNLGRLRRKPLFWLYEAYLTLRYVDKYKVFPAIRFNSYVDVNFKKNGGKLQIDTLLIFEGFVGGRNSTIIMLNRNSTLVIEGEFVLGDGIKVLLYENAKLIVRGKSLESGSGITGNSVILVMHYLEIGKDCIIAWDTFLTDSDWHSIDGKSPVKETIIGDHVWIGVGTKILKGTNIGKNSIVTTNSVLFNNYFPEKALISGNPGKVVKSNIPDWHRDLKFTVQEYLQQNNK